MKEFLVTGVISKLDKVKNHVLLCWSERKQIIENHWKTLKENIEKKTENQEFFNYIFD